MLKVFTNGFAKIASIIRSTFMILTKDRLLVIFIISLALLDLLIKLSSDMVFFNVRSSLFNFAWYSFFIALSYKFKKHRSRMIYFVSITSLFYILSFSNILYFRYYESFLSVSLIKQLSLFAAMPDSDQIGTELISIYDVIVTLSFITTIVFYLTFGRASKVNFEKISVEKRKLFRGTFYRMAGISFFTAFLFLKGAQFSQVTKMWNRPIVLENFGLINYHIVDTVKSASLFIDFEISDENYQRFTDYYKNLPEYAPNRYTGIFENKNVIVIHAESIESFVINRELDGQEITPYINQLVRSGYYYSNTYSQESVGTSSDSEFVFSTSLLPVNNGTIFLTHYDHTYLSMQKVLKAEKGYSIVSMHGNNGSFWNRDVMHAQLGYDFFYDKKYYDPISSEEKIGLGISDEAFFAKSIDYLNRLSEPYYATLITLTNHTPWPDVDKYVTYDQDDQQVEFSCGVVSATQLCNYLKAVHYSDYAIGEFIQQLSDHKMLDDTVIVIYGDHPANLKITEMEKLYGQSLSKIAYKAQQQVPFIIWSQDIEDGIEFDRAIGMMDASVILQNMLGVNNQFALGRDYNYNFNKEDLIVYEEDALGDKLYYLNPLASHIVPFVNGDWTDGVIYYDDFRKKYVILDETIDSSLITNQYLKFQNARAEEIISISNLINKYDALEEYYKREEEAETTE